VARKAPLSPLSGPALDAADDALVEAFDLGMAAAASRAGPLFRCYAGRRDCCRGLFPINLLDARRLQRGMRALDEEDPARATAVRTRAKRVVRRVARDFPGDPSTGLFDGDEPSEEAFCSRHGATRCPALDGESGRCDLYRWRPLACRSMGPPVRLGGVNLDGCPYCFGPASPDEVERCRAVPDSEGREEALLDALEAREDRTGETVIPFALIGLPVPRR
jgi:Fe-S-cluster containining protein